MDVLISPIDTYKKESEEVSPVSSLLLPIMRLSGVRVKGLGVKGRRRKCNTLLIPLAEHSLVS